MSTKVYDPVKQFQDNIKLTTFFAKRWFPMIPEYLQEEYIAEARVGLWISCKRFDLNKEVAFSTYAGQIINNRLMQFNRNRFAKMRAPESEVSLQDITEQGVALENVIGYELDFISDISCKELIDRLEKYKHLKLLVIYNKSQQQIAKILRCSQSTVSRNIDKQREELRKELAS